MRNLAVVACAALFSFSAANAQSAQFSKYKSIEAYEVRPGILLMPRYAIDGQVCEIGLETKHYSSEVIHIDSVISSKDIDQLLDELAPENERGPRSKDYDLTLGDGDGLTTIREYENVSVQIYAKASSSCEKGAICTDGIVAVTITWKNRKCA